MKLNKDSLHARSLLLPLVKQTCLVMVGCGGTGSWLAPHVVRVARLLQEARDQQTTVIFWDHDHVEPKNIFRQNFCEAEVGNNKAVTLAQRYGNAWGIPITAIDTPVDRSVASRHDLVPSYNEQRITVMITCVDNNRARCEVAKMCKSWPIWWLDTGNIKTAGQVSIGRSWIKDEPSPLRFPSKTTWLPMPTQQFPEILMPSRSAARNDDYSELSCAELALVDEQGLSINHAVASAAASVLMKMLVTGDLHYHCVHVSTDFGTSLTYNSPRIIRKYLQLHKQRTSTDAVTPHELDIDD